MLNQHPIHVLNVGLKAEIYFFYFFFLKIGYDYSKLFFVQNF